LKIDDTIETNHISTQLEYSLSPWQQKHTQPYGRVNIELISSQGEKLIIIQFRSLKLVVVPIESQEPLTRIDLLWMSLIELMMIKRDGLSPPVKGQGSKIRFNRHLFVVETDKIERRALIIPREEEVQEHQKAQNSAY